MNNLLFLPMLIHVLWAVVLYALLTLVRAPKVWGIGANADGSNPYAKLEPKISANLTNQFEWPVLFYAISVILIARPEFYDAFLLWCAWVFVLGRIMHSVVQIFTGNIRLRGIIFTINFIAVLCMWLSVGFTLI